MSEERVVRVTLVSKPGCHLCSLAAEVIERVTGELGVGWEQVSITDLPDPNPLWWEQLPVTLVDGQQHDYWRVSESRLREALAHPAPVTGEASAPVTGEAPAI